LRSTRPRYLRTETAGSRRRRFARFPRFNARRSARRRPLGRRIGRKGNGRWAERAVTFVGKTANDTCTYTGPYQQTGRFGRVSGSYACTSGSSGQFTFYEMGRDDYAIRARTLVALPSGCIANGDIVALEQPPPLQ